MSDSQNVISELRALISELREILNPKRFIPAKQWNDYHPWPSPGAIRNLIAKRHENGMDRVLFRGGPKPPSTQADQRPWLIDEAEFLDLIRRWHNE